MEPAILVVDDEEPSVASVRASLMLSGLSNVIPCTDSSQVMAILARERVDTLLIDLNMPPPSGRDLLPLIREQHPDLPVIVVTGVNEVDIAVDCMRLGIFDYLVKPFDKARLVASTTRAVEMVDLRRENSSLKSRLISHTLSHPEAFREILFRGEPMASVLLYADSIAETPQPVLITGETGVGKELFARAIHEASGRKGELVAVNVAGYDETMFSDALFGHLKGAFTGAERARGGLVERAAAGTLFLDEIGDLRLESQVKLLRLLENKEYYPLGSDVTRRTDARIVLATNKDLAAESEAGRFRRDLYFRLRTHHVHIPPLRERPNDLRPLIDTCVREAARELNRPVPEISPSLYSALRVHEFPGNIRELKVMLYDALSRRGEGPLRLPGANAAEPAGDEASGAWFAGFEPLPTIREATRALIAEAIQRSQGNQSMAARALGITPQALNQRLRKSEDE